MKKHVLSCVSFGIVCLCMSARAGQWSDVKKQGTLRLASDGTFAPFNFYKDAKLSGFEVELGQALATKMGLKYTWKTTAFDSLLIGLSQDRYDVVAASHGITAERSKVVDFTDPHYCTGVVLVSKKGGPKNLAELKGKSAAIQVGTIFAPPLMKVPGIKDVKTYKQDTDCLQALLAGRVDVWVTDKFVAQAALKNHADADLSIGDTVLEEEVAMAVSKGNVELLSQVNGALAALMKNGDYQKLSQKYFNKDISCAKK